MFLPTDPFLAHVSGNKEFFMPINCLCALLFRVLVEIIMLGIAACYDLSRQLLTGL